MINTFFSLKENENQNKKQKQNFKKIGSILILILLKQILNLDNKSLKHNPFILNILKDISYSFNINFFNKLCSKCDVDYIENNNNNNLNSSLKTYSPSQSQIPIINSMPFYQQIQQYQEPQQQYEEPYQEPQQQYKEPESKEEENENRVNNMGDLNKTLLNNIENLNGNEKENELKNLLEMSMQIPDIMPDLPNIETIDEKFKYYT